MTCRLTLVAVCLAALTAGSVSAPASAQELPRATPEAVGLSSERLQEATRRLQAQVEAGDIAGVVAGVVRHGRLVYLEALGDLDLDRDLPMRDDALFRLYSMTRPITSLAAMILWEEDRFELDDPVSLYLPEFANQRVFVDAFNPDVAATRERRTEMTVEHLLLHTSGLGSRGSAIYRAEQVRLRSIALPQMVSNAARVPLFENPGTRWRYGISTTILGRLVEVWSGMPFDAFLQERVFEPLGMTDTVFRVDPSRADRFGPAYRPGPDGALRPHAIEAVPFTEQSAADRRRRRAGVDRARLPAVLSDVPRRRRAERRPGPRSGNRGADDRQPRSRRPAADRLRQPAARPRLDARLLCGHGRRRFSPAGQRGHLLVGRLLRHPVLHRPGGGHGDRHHGGRVARPTATASGRRSRRRSTPQSSIDARGERSRHLGVSYSTSRRCSRSWTSRCTSRSRTSPDTSYSPDRRSTMHSRVAPFRSEVVRKL